MSYGRETTAIGHRFPGPKRCSPPIRNVCLQSQLQKQYIYTNIVLNSRAFRSLQARGWDGEKSTWQCGADSCENLSPGHLFYSNKTTFPHFPHFLGFCETRQISPGHLYSEVKLTLRWKNYLYPGISCLPMVFPVPGLHEYWCT